MKEPWKQHELYRKTVEYLPVAFVEQFLGNALRKNEIQMSELESDIRDNGFEHPLTIIVGKFDHKVKLGEGNHRLAIAKRLGLSEVPIFTVLYDIAGDSISGYDTIIYPYLNASIANMERMPYPASEVFTKFEVLFERRGKFAWSRQFNA